MSRRPKPRHLKMAQGTYRADRDQGAPEPEGSIPDPPEELLLGDPQELLVHRKSGTVHLADGDRSLCGRLARRKAKVQSSGDLTCRVCQTRAAALEPDSIALRAWNRLAPILHRQGLLAEDYRDALAIYCATYERWAQARKVIKEDGLVSISVSGTESKSPAVNIEKECAQQMRLFMVEFGLTPASRPKVHATETKKPKNKFAAVRGGKAG